MFLKDLNKFNSDYLDGKHASNSANNVPVLDSGAKVPLAQLPTGTTKNTLSLGNHTHAYAGSNSVGGAATSALKCTGNSATATTLETARTINNTSFDGSTNITTSIWGTSRTLTIGNKGKSVNGSGNVSWSLTEIGAAADSHTHDYLPLAGGTMTGHINMNAGKGIYGTTTGDVTTTDGTTYNGTLSILMYNGSNNLHVGAGVWDKKINQGNTYISAGANAYIRTVDPNGEIGFQINGSSRLKLNDSGITLLKPLTMSKNSVAGAINFTKTDGTQVTGLYLTSGDKIKLGNDSTSTYIYSSTNPKINVGGASTSYYIYHEGNKPSPADIGAAASSHGHSTISIKGNNTISSTSNDTTSNWGAQGNSVHWYTNTGQLIDQPNQWGYILNIGSGSEVHQIWMTQASGSLCHRGGNGSGWSGSWREILDSSNFKSHVTPSAIGAAPNPHWHVNATTKLWTGNVGIGSTMTTENLSGFNYILVGARPGNSSCEAWACVPRNHFNSSSDIYFQICTETGYAKFAMKITNNTLTLTLSSGTSGSTLRAVYGGF